MRARRSAGPAAGGGAGKLVVTGGPAVGQEFTLSGDEAVIGRSSENAISIPDTSVSRKHVLMRKTQAGWAASDMGSGNGTLVNGAAIAEETPLKHGDVVTLGDTELRFEEPGGASLRRPPVRRGEAPTGPVNTSGRTRAVVRTSRRGAGELNEDRTKKKKLLIRVGGLLVLLLAGAVGWRVVKSKEAAAALIQSMSEGERKKALTLMKQEGTNLVREGRWKEAKAKFLELQAEAPDFEAEQLAQLLAAADREIPNQERLAECADAVAKGEIAAAARALEQVTSETTQFKQRDKLREAIDKRIGERINDGRALLASTNDRAKMVELKALVEDVLVARPEHRDALAYKETADEAIRRIDAPPPPPVDNRKPWLEVQQRFQSGDQTGAFALAEACAGKYSQCKALRGQIKEFGEKLKRAESASPNELLSLIDLDKKIGGAPSPHARTFIKKTADAFYLKASNAKATGNWQTAIDNARKAISADPGHPGASALLQDARTQAKDVYLRGYQMKDSAPEDALKLFKDVMSMTPRDDEYHQKAKARIAELAQ